MKTLVNRDFCKKKLDTRFDTHCIKTGVQLWWTRRGSNPRPLRCEKILKTFLACFCSFWLFPLDLTLSVSPFNGLFSVCSDCVCGRFCGQKRFPPLTVGFPPALSGKRFAFCCLHCNSGRKVLQRFSVRAGSQILRRNYTKN